MIKVNFGIKIIKDFAFMSLNTSRYFYKFGYFKILLVLFVYASNPTYPQFSFQDSENQMKGKIKAELPNKMFACVHCIALYF